MNKSFFFKPLIAALLIGGVALFSSCSSDSNHDPIDKGDDQENPPIGRSYITIAGAAMNEQPGDARGGVFMYPVKLDDARDPDYKVNIFDEGFQTVSGVTARLQSSEDGNTIFSLVYGGEDGGQMYKYFIDTDNPELFSHEGYANGSQYVGTNPRWVKLFDGDQTAMAVNIGDIKNNNEGKEDEPYRYTRGKFRALAYDIPTGGIRNYSEEMEIPLTEEEEEQGHYLWRPGASVLNKAGDKLFVGIWMAKTDPATGERDQNEYDRLGAKFVVLDYPELENPKVITSEKAFGDAAGYRSFSSFLDEKGDIYAAIQWNAHGKSHFMKIGQNDEFDNSYSFELDPILGEDTRIYAWAYHKNGIAYIAYGLGEDDNKQGFARVDLYNRTAEPITEIPMGDYKILQHQYIAINGDEAYISAAQLGKDGNLFIVNIDGTVTKGAQLINKTGNNFISAL